MKVLMLTGLAGADFSLSPGDEYECSDGEAKRLIEAGFAAPVEVKKAKVTKETATVKAEVETRG